MDQIILAVDDNGKFSGEYIPKSVGHTGEGTRHLAITVLLYNSKGQVLLQKRKHQNFDNIWCFTGDTHPLHTNNGDETVEEATWRCLEVEYQIKDISVRNLGFFNYFAKKGERCENEHCAMMVGEYDGEFNMSDEVGYEYKWVKKEEFLKDFEENPKKWAPWVPGGIEILKQTGFFN